MPLPPRLRTFLTLTCMLLACAHAQAFWWRAHDEPPPIVRTEPPSAKEVQSLGFGQRAMNDQVVRFGLARHVPLIPDWSAAQSGKLLASWNPVQSPGPHPTRIAVQGAPWSHWY